jgi:hypothetical protein
MPRPEQTAQSELLETPSVIERRLRARLGELVAAQPVKDEAGRTGQQGPVAEPGPNQDHGLQTVNDSGGCSLLQHGHPREQIMRLNLNLAPSRAAARSALVGRLLSLAEDADRAGLGEEASMLLGMVYSVLGSVDGFDQDQATSKGDECGVAVGGLLAP